MYEIIKSVNSDFYFMKKDKTHYRLSGQMYFSSLPELLSLIASDDIVKSSETVNELNMPEFFILMKFNDVDDLKEKYPEHFL